MLGYNGKILFVDLSAGAIEEYSPSEEVYRSYIGGAGLGVRILYERMKPGVDPLGPDNILGFMTGPLSGTTAPMSSRHTIVTKSPLTGTWGDANSGGLFSSALKAAGYDAVFFSGISPKPVYLLIHNGKVELRDAGHLWGKDTHETEEAIQQEMGDKGLKIASIGSAGERLSLIASVVADRGRVAARSGVGAVMGAKKLKAVAIRGTGKAKLANPGLVNKLRKDALKALTEDLDAKPFVKMLRDWGTCHGPLDLMPVGAAPVKNWNLLGEAAFPDYIKIAGDNVVKYQLHKDNCGNCPISCGGAVSIKEGQFATEARKPEYETLAALGLMCLNSDVESIIKANDICDRCGIDTISVGTVIAFAIECYEKGIISKLDTEGIELTWGNAPAIIALLEKIVMRSGFGDVLADGVKRAAERIGKGTDAFAMHIHSQEPGMHDPRFSPYRGLGYISSATPGRHMIAQASLRISREGKLGPYPELQAPDKKDEVENIGEIHALGTSYSQVFSDSGLCLVALSGGINYPMVEFISAVTGWDFTVAEAITVGKRVLTLRQAFNVREGCLDKDFTLPQRIAQPPTMAPYTGRSIDFAALKSSYYKSMGWDSKSGIPTAKCLAELGFKELVGTL